LGVASLAASFFVFKRQRKFINKFQEEVQRISNLGERVEILEHDKMNEEYARIEMNKLK